MSTSPSPEVFADWLSAALLPEVHLSFEKLAAMQHEGAWADVAAKAKRLVQQGSVTILRNAPHHVMSHVRGDHGEYNCEISRNDPGSQIIEQWNCECPWAQFAFDRTRKWKALEGRVCSHVLATFWKGKSTPLDMGDQEPGYQAPRGQKVGPAGPGQETLPEMGMTPDTDQRIFDPNEEGVSRAPEGEETTPESPAIPETPFPTKPQEHPQAQPSTQDLTIPKAPESPFGTPKAPAIPQREQLQLFDITAPPGMQPIPGAAPVSVPGGRPPTPGNPVVFPGTFSHFIPVMTMRTSAFIVSKDALTDYFEMQRNAHRPITVALTNLVALERSGGKLPVPGALSYGTSSEGVPLYRVADLGWNPTTGQRENSDVNALQGAPEQQGTYSDASPGKRCEVLDFDPALKMAYVVLPLNYPEGGDVRLHPHSLKGWVDYADIRPVQDASTVWRKR